jgi:hypothetical protein
MRILSNILGVLLLVAGCVWFLQGVSVLPGSFMTGSAKWAIIGGICIIAGISLLLSANRRKS